MEVFVAGTGAPVVLVCAVALAAPTWLRVLASPLRHRYRFILAHQPGYGVSEPFQGVNNRLAGHQIRAAVRAVGVDEPVHLVASCLGSVSALHYAADYPSDVSSLTLVGAFHDASDLQGGDPSTMSSEEFARLARTAVATLNADFDAVIEQMRSGGRPQDVAGVDDARALLLGSQCVNFLVALRYLNEMMTGSVLPIYETLRVPCMCVYGDADAIIKPRHSHDIAEAVLDSRIECIPGAGHFPYLTHAPAYNRILEDFFESTSAARAVSLAAGGRR